MTGAHWIVERGIGETRAALVDAGRIVAARIERPGLRASTILPARLGARQGDGRRALVQLDGGGEALLSPVPQGLTEGAALIVDIVREPFREIGGRSRAKPPLARPAGPDAVPAPGPDLAARIAAGDLPVRTLHPHEPDALEAAGWSELLAEAMDGAVAFPGGALLLSLTPAMTLIDIDGAAAPLALSLAAAKAVGAAIERHDLQGSIGIDFPTLAPRAERQAVGDALDAALARPAERAAMNGFGFVQLAIRRERASLPELLQGDRRRAHSLALLRRAERAGGQGPITLTAHPAIERRIAAEGGWHAELERRTGRPVHLRADPKLRLGGGHVQAEHP